MSSVLLYVCLLGWAIFMPGLNGKRTAWLGFRFYITVLTLPLFLYTGNVLLSVPLTSLAWVYGAAALIGSGVVIVRDGWNWRRCLTEFTHPIFVFPVLLLAVAVGQGGIEYLPYPGDETASWLRYARQVFLADAYWSENLIYHHGAYTNGWPLMIAFANVFQGYFSDDNGIVLLFFLHVSVLGFVYDLTRWVCRREGLKDVTSIHIIAWLLVLGLLAIEASWILFPTFQLIEKPLLYAFLGAFLLAWAGQYDEFDRTRLSAFLGVAVASGYLIKISMLVFGPAMAILWLSFYWRGFRDDQSQDDDVGLFDITRLNQGLGRAALMLIPVFVVAATWSQLRVGAECFASPLGHLADSAVGADKRWLVAQIVGNAALSYVFQFKLPITIGGVLVFAVSWAWPRARWFLATVVVFVLFYMLALHSAYYFCFSPFGESGLQSFQRYFRPNLRLIHFFAPILATFFLLQFLAKREQFKKILSNPRAQIFGLIMISVLMVLQVSSVSNSLIDISTRNQQAPVIRKSILNAKEESARMVKLIAAKKLSNPRVSIIAQKGYNVEINLGSYFGIKSRRGGAYFHYTPVPPYSWGPNKLSLHGRVLSKASLIEWWRGMDIIWPVLTDSWTKEVLSEIVADKNCLIVPEDWFFFKDKNGDFYCVPKTNKISN